jgi:hypothetical protein
VVHDQHLLAVVAVVGMPTTFVLRWHSGHRKIRSKLAVGPLGVGTYPSLCDGHGPYPGG